MQSFRVIIWKFLLLLLPLLLLIKAQDYENFESWDSDDLQDWLKDKRVASRITKEIDAMNLDGEGLLTEARNGFRELDLDENDQQSLLKLLCRNVDDEFCDDITNNRRSGSSSKKNRERTRRDSDEDFKRKRRSSPTESKGKKGSTARDKRKKNKYLDSKDDDYKLYDNRDKESEEEEKKQQTEMQVLNAMIMDTTEKLRVLEEKFKEEKTTKQDYRADQLRELSEQLRQLDEEKKRKSSSIRKKLVKKAQPKQNDLSSEKNEESNDDDSTNNLKNSEDKYEDPDNNSDDENDSKSNGDSDGDGDGDGDGDADVDDVDADADTDSDADGDGDEAGDDGDEDDIDKTTMEELMQDLKSFLSRYSDKKTTLPPPPPSRSENREKSDNTLTECFLIIQGQTTKHKKYDYCTKILHKWIEQLIPTEDSPSQGKSDTVSVSIDTNQQSEITENDDNTKKSDTSSEYEGIIDLTDIEETDFPTDMPIGDASDQNKESNDIESQVPLDALDSSDNKYHQQGQESPQGQNEPYSDSELSVTTRGSTKINVDTSIERVTFVVKENPRLVETKSYRVNWWRKGQASQKMYQIFDKNGKEPLEISILPEIAYEADVEALNDQDTTVARSEQKFIQDSTPLDNMGEVCTSTRLKVRGYKDNSNIQLKNLEVNLVQQGAGQSSGWDVDPNDRMTVFGPLTRHGSSLGDKNIAENIRYMMFNVYKIPRVEVSQVCLVAFEGSEPQPYVSGTQLLVGGSLLVIVIGLFLLRQRLKPDEGAAMLSSLKNTMGKFGGVLAANTRLGGNSMNNNSNANEIGKNYNTITHGSSGGKRGHAHGSDSDDEELRITNGTNETDTIMDTGDDDVGNENRMSHSNNVAVPKTAVNLTKRGNYDEKKTRKTDFISTSSQASEPNERRGKETTKHSNKNTEPPKRHSKSSTENVRENTEKSNSGGSRKNLKEREKEKAKKQSKQTTKRKETQPSDDDSDGNRSLEEEQAAEEEEEEEEEQEKTTTKRNNKADTSSANANKNDESSVDFEDF